MWFTEEEMSKEVKDSAKWLALIVVVELIILCNWFVARSWTDYNDFYKMREWIAGRQKQEVTRPSAPNPAP